MTQVDASKRSFLRGQRSGRHALIPPPWARSEFTELCQRCDDCISACEQHIIVKGDGGYPHVDFSQGECVFCEACAQACKHKVFDLQQQSPWSLVASIDEQCLSKNAVVCRSCGDRCEQDAIHFQLMTGGRSDPQVSQDLCNGCGACFAVCPTRSIQIKEAA